MLSPFRTCLNTSTIRGQKLPLVQSVDLTADAGYNAIEPWIDEIDRYVAEGGALPDLRKRLEDRNLAVASAIGFFDWIVNDDAQRAKGLEEARRNFDLVAQLGGKHLAAPPMGATDQPDFDLARAAERYAALFDLGAQFGVTPLVEVWGFSQFLNRLGQAAYIALESGRPNARILADVYHLHRGGSGHAGLSLLQGAALPVFHVNDYPAEPAWNKLADSDRVYPGDGAAPLRAIFQTLQAIGFDGYLSLELFNESYWRQDAATVAQTGLAKLRAAIEGV